MTETDQWSDYWNNEGTSGEVFINKSGERHPQLAAYWHTQISGAHSTSRIIDLACGAGSIYSDLHKEHTFSLFGVDLSVDGLHLLKHRLPNTSTVVCSITELPFPERSFDLVVSQFGIEYGGATAFADAASLVNSGGRIAMLCHIEDGYIDARNKLHLGGAKLIIESEFIPRAVELAKSAFAREPARRQKAETEFTQANDQIASILEQNPGGIHSHVYFGFKQLFQRVAHYDESDITTWLETIHADVNKTIAKLATITDVALSEHSIKQICRDFTHSGLRKVGYSPFAISGNSLPIAWSITAERP